MQSDLQGEMNIVCESCPCLWEGPLDFSCEFVGPYSRCSRLLLCPEGCMSFWRCYTSQGENSNLKILQAVQFTLQRPYPDASLMRPRLQCSEARKLSLLGFDAYCVFDGAKRLGPYALGCGFPISGVLDSLHLTLILCKKDIEDPLGLAFCESFVCTLALSIRPLVPESLGCFCPCVLLICGSVPWKCAATSRTWDEGVHRRQVVRCSCPGINLSTLDGRSGKKEVFATWERWNSCTTWKARAIYGLRTRAFWTYLSQMHTPSCCRSAQLLDLLVTTRLCKHI